jgi:hypothetical protein
MTVICMCKKVHEETAVELEVTELYSLDKGSVKEVHYLS